MVKNVIIALQAVVIVSGILWAKAAERETYQAHLVTGMNLMSADVRLMTKVERLVAGGELQLAQRALLGAVKTNVHDMQEIVGALDLSKDGQVTEVREIASRLDEVGIHDVSAAIDQRSKATRK